MSMLRHDFDDLPEAARRAVAIQTGHIHAARTAGGGLNSGIAAVVDADGGRCFIKGIPADHAQAVSQKREIAISPFLPATCPRLLWHVEAGGWVLLGYEVIDGRHADYMTDKDVPLVLEALQEVQQVTAPAHADLKAAEVRWAKYVNDAERALFVGDTLLHTDWTPANVLISEQRARVVDWAWPTRGAAFIDPYLLALHLVQGGQTVDSAVAWVARVDSWSKADRIGIQAFAKAVTRMWRDIAAQDPKPWKVMMAGHAAELQRHLLVAR